jgi:hypothetical protein
MKLLRLASLIGACALTVALMGCQPPSAAIAEPAVTPIVAPTAQPFPLPDLKGQPAQQVAATFFTWYAQAVREGMQRGERLTLDAVAETGYLEPALVERLRTDLAAMQGGFGGADPVLCAQDVPSEVRVTVVTADADQATLALTSDLIGHGLMIEMAQRDGLWRIANIGCGGTQASAAAPLPTTAPASPSAAQQEALRPGWQVFVSPNFGYSLGYPTEWVLQEHLADPNQPPIGPEQVKAISLIMPQAWAEAMAKRQGPPDPNAPVIAPFTLEVVRGDKETLGQVYVAPTQSETLELSGVAVRRDVEQITDTLSLVRYIVQHPGDPQLWLVFTDPISGFPERLEGNEETLATLTEIVASLRFN